MKDMHTIMRTVPVIPAVAIGANATKTGKIIDLQGYGGIEFACTYGAVVTTGTVATAVMFEGAVTATMTSVADADMLGTEALASLLAATPRTSGTTKNVTKRVGYKGSKRYVRVDIVSTGVTSVGCVNVDGHLFYPNVSPTLNP